MDVSIDKCLRCNGKMSSIGTEKIQLGQFGLLTGYLSNLMAGGLEVEIYICTNCGKIEFFSVNESAQNELPQVKCPECGYTHDFDYPKCPRCKHRY